MNVIQHGRYGFETDQTYIVDIILHDQHDFIQTIKHEHCTELNRTRNIKQHQQHAGNHHLLALGTDFNPTLGTQALPTETLESWYHLPRRSEKSLLSCSLVAVLFLPVFPFVYPFKCWFTRLSIYSIIVPTWIPGCRSITIITPRMVYGTMCNTMNDVRYQV